MSTIKVINAIHPSGSTNNIVLDASGNATVGNNLTVTGTSSFTGSLGNITTGTISSGAVTSSSTVSATALIPTGSSIPTNGEYLPATNTLGWATNSIARMRLDSNGRLGVMATPNVWLASWSPVDIGAGSSIVASNDYNTVIASNAYLDNVTPAWVRKNAGYTATIEVNSGNVGTIRTYTAGTSTAGSSISFTAGPYVANLGTSWTNSSDERLKDIIEPISNGLNKVGQLRAVIGKFKTDPIDKRRSFLIAQDVQKVLPEAVDVSDPNSLGVQYTDVIPLLVAAIKELKSTVEQLESRLAVAEGKLTIAPAE